VTLPAGRFATWSFDYITRTNSNRRWHMEWSIVQAAVLGSMDLGGVRFAALMAFAVAGMPACILIHDALRLPKLELTIDPHEEPIRHAA
jgi:hypothetical protein